LPELTTSIFIFCPHAHAGSGVSLVPVTVYRGVEAPEFTTHCVIEVSTRRRDPINHMTFSYAVGHRVDPRLEHVDVVRRDHIHGEVRGKCCELVDLCALQRDRVGHDPPPPELARVAFVGLYVLDDHEDGGEGVVRGRLGAELEALPGI